MIEELVGILAALSLTWIAFLIIVWVNRPPDTTLRQILGLTPRLLLLLKCLATDRRLSWRLRVRVWLLLAYLAFPLDVVPDFLPVVGYADDVVLTLLVLRSVLRRAGSDYLLERWTGSRQELDLVLRASGSSGST